jgi:hypothetical protein
MNIPPRISKDPDCQHKSSCLATGVGLCRGCAASITVRRSWAGQDYRLRTIENMREVGKRTWTDPEIRAKRIAGLRAAHKRRRAQLAAQV